LEVVAKAIYLLKFYSGLSMLPATVWIIFTRILNERDISVVIQFLS